MSDLRGNRIKRTAAQTAMLMLVLTVISKGMGFARELVLAGAYGTSYIVDAYVMAHSIPSILLGGVFAAIGTAYMPTFSGIAEKEGQDGARRFTNQIMTLAILVALTASLLCMVFSDQITWLFAGSFETEARSLTSNFLKITAWILGLTCATSMLNAYLQYNGSFLRPIAAGFLFDIGVVAVIIISAFTDYHYLAVGLLLGYGMQFAAMYIFARKKGYHYRPDFKMSAPIRQIVVLAIPVFVGTTIGQINAFVDKSLAASLPEGSVAALNYGWLLICLITTMTTTIISTILYPKLTKAVTNEDWNYFHIVGGKSVAVTVMIAVPLSLGALAFSQQVVQVVYERGAFNTMSTALTGEAFFFYGMGIVFIALQTLLTQVYYSMRDMKTPLTCSAINVTVNIVLNLLLIDSMAHCGLALASSCAVAVNAVLLLVLLYKRHPQAKILPNAGKILRICICAVLAVSAAIAVYQLVSLVWMPRLCYLLLAVGASVLVYLILLKLFKIEELDVLKELIRR